MTWLLMGWKGLRSAFSLIASHPWPALAIVLCAALAWQTVGKQRLASDNKALATRLVEQRAEYVAAQDKAAQEHLAAKQAAEQRYRTLAQRTDHEAETALDDARARADAYVRRMRAEVSCRPSGQTPSPAGGGYPESPERPSVDASLVALSRQDFDTLVENTIRLDAAHKWAMALNQDMPKPEFGD